MPQDQFASMWTLNKTAVFAEAMECAARADMRRTSRSRNAAAKRDRASHWRTAPVAGQPVVKAPARRLTPRLTAIIIGALTVSGIAAFGLMA